jgi:hypothetical protein
MTTEIVSGSTFRRRAVALWKCVLGLNLRAPRRLRLCESVALGERRFVAVVEYDAARFLVGGTSSSLVLLSRLEDAGPLAEGEPSNRVPWRAAATSALGAMPGATVGNRPVKKC